MIPPELTRPPLRDPATAPAIFDRYRGDIRVAVLGAIIGAPLFGLLLWLRLGPREQGLVVLGAIFLAGYMLHGAWQARRAMSDVLPLFRRGVPTLGRVRRVEAPGDRAYSAPVRLEVEFTDGEGAARVGVVETTVPNQLIDRRTGVPIAVLYLPYDPTRIAVYTEALGLVPGTAVPPAST